MRTFAILWLLVCPLTTGCGGSPPPRALWGYSRAASTDKAVWVVQYGYDKSGELAVVAFIGKQKPNDGVEGIVRFGTADSWLDKPDGTRVNLPSGVQLYEFVNGKYRESNERVSDEDFKAFLASKPEEYTIDALLAFVKSHRAGKG